MATPTTILKRMKDEGVEGLTKEHVASHLQKHRNKSKIEAAQEAHCNKSKMEDAQDAQRAGAAVPAFEDLNVTEWNAGQPHPRVSPLSELAPTFQIQCVLVGF